MRGVKIKINKGIKISNKILIASFLLVIILSCFASAKTDDKLYDELQSKEKVRAIVILSDETGGNAVRGSARQMAVAEKNNKDARASAISSIGEEKILHKFKAGNSFSALISEDDLTNLENNPNVKMILADRKLKLHLQNSTALINATGTWNLMQSENHLTGKGRTVCILDSGINYSHSDFGGCSIVNYSLSGNQQSNVLQSEHNYTNNVISNWTISMENFTSIAVHFVNISIENSWDHLRILDANNGVVASYTGEHQDFWSPSVEGNNITIIIDADEAVNAYGFYIDLVINGTTNASYNWNNCSKIIYGWDLMNNDPNPYDDNGHGTHVSGIVSANGTIKGVAPESNIIAVKVTNSAGDTSSLTIAEGIEFCTNLSEEYNVSVITMSIGSDVTVDAYCDALDPLTAIVVDAAVAKNITVIASTGNDGLSQNISFPACIYNVTRVGATDKMDGVASYSNLWNLTMFFAPGGNSSGAGNINSTSDSGGYELMSGTSMAAPHVAGAVAILQQFWLEQNNSFINNERVFTALNSTGVQIDGGLSRNYSRINISGAVLYLDQQNPNVSILKSTNTSVEYFEDSINISWNISDFSLSSSEFNMTYPNGTLIISSNQSSGLVVLNYSNLSAEGNYSIKAYAVDCNMNDILNQDSFFVENSSNTAVEFNSSKAIPNFEWKQEEYIANAVNLSEYFIEPDGDSLTYIMVGASQVTMSVSNNVATFGSPANFYGQESVWINASDANSSAISNTFTLVVTRKSTGGGGGGGGGGSITKKVVNTSNTTNNTSANLTNSTGLNQTNNLTANITANLTNTSAINTTENMTFNYTSTGGDGSGSIIDSSATLGNNSSTVNEALGKAKNISMRIHEEENSSVNVSLESAGKNKMSPETSKILIKALAGVASVIAILLVIAIVNKFARKRAEHLNAKFKEEMKKKKAEEKKTAVNSKKQK